ncbi:hypothetical protein CHS0354_006843 [Potamilus streckersoni]|uniref:Type-4 uracil-DNA glycosylase n=1 Tax=Potamilus streckersoni TaxID=2493646 RepID=A0AAE0TE93_9BIVA|nr:hypothetical protein CHS0354_006843 [Potamilus streckersoni]
MSEKLPITKEGFEALKEQLRHLTQVERPKIVRDIEVARSYGDLKENAEYHAAKEKQGMIEAKINKLNADLATSEVIDISRMAGNSIKFGALVKFINNDTEEEQMYRIVGPAEKRQMLNLQNFLKASFRLNLRIKTVQIINICPSVFLNPHPPAPESNLPPRKSFTDVNPFSPPTESAGAKASPEKPQSGRQWEDTENIRSAKNIDTLRLRMLGCERCGLCKARTRLVFGAGSHSADVFFIGEGPGQEEDKQGLPFVGRSGVLLTQMMYAAGLNRDGIYISNIVKCRPPNNRNPQPEEVAQCLPVLERQIELIAPSLIVLLGSVALKALMPENSLPISRSREQFMEYRGIPVLVTFHPAYILRRPEALYDAWNDFRRIRAFLSKLRKSSSAL